MPDEPDFVAAVADYRRAFPGDSHQDVMEMPWVTFLAYREEMRSYAARLKHAAELEKWRTEVVPRWKESLRHAR